MKQIGRTQIKRALWVVVSIGLAVMIFLFAIPKFADYGQVWHSIETLTPVAFGWIMAATIFSLFTYWWANMAALPGLRLWPSAVLTQTTTSVANTLPGGGALAVGMTYRILRSWGFSGSDTTLYVGTTGIWNIFTKLALPVASVAFLVLSGHSSAAYVTAAAAGIATLGVTLGCLATVFSSERLARKVGDDLGRAASVLRRAVRRPAVSDTGERVAQFRRESIGLVRRRWAQLTFTTILSHLGLFLVLLLALRHMGVNETDVGNAEAFAVFAFSRLLSAVPITPGGVGVIDLGYVGGMTQIDPAHKPQIVAAVLLFRLLTFGIQIPLGGLTYLVWRRKRAWRKERGSGRGLVVG